MSVLVGVPPISMSPPECLFGRLLVGGMEGLAEDVIAETFADRSSNTLPSVFSGIYFPKDFS